MIVIIGLAILVVAVIVAIVGVLANTGIDHALTDNFSVLGYHVTGSTGALFLCGIVVGAVAVFGLSVLLAGARHTAARGRDARRELSRSHQEMDLANRDRTTLLEQQRSGADHDAGADSRDGRAGRSDTSRLDRWRGRQLSNEGFVESDRHRTRSNLFRSSRTGSTDNGRTHR